MNRTIISACLALGLAAFATACDNESLGGALSDLNGEYKIPGHKCWIKIDGSAVTAVDRDGQSPCVEEEGDFYWSYSETLEVEGTVSEDHVVGTMTYVEAYSESWENCDYSGSESATFDLDISKDKGRQASGRFAALAGDWAGTLTLVEEYAQVLEPGPDCPEDPFDEEFDDTTDFDVTAAIKGQEAEIEYCDGDDCEDFGVEVESDDEIEIDGEEVEIR